MGVVLLKNDRGSSTSPEYCGVCRRKWRPDIHRPQTSLSEFHAPRKCGRTQQQPYMSVNGESLSMVTGDENNNSHEDDEGVKEEQYEQD